jgi:hypothetical protein
MSVTSSITSLATKHLVLNSDLSPNASIFDVLPEEIVVRILEWCDVGGVLACKRVGLLLCPLFTTLAHHIIGNGDLNRIDLSRIQKHDCRFGQPALQTRLERKRDVR